MLARTLATLALLGSAVAAQAAVVYTDRAAWELAIGGSSITDTFDADQAGALSVTFASGVVSEGFGTFGALDFANSISGGRYQGSVDNDETGGIKAIVWTFPTAITAFGADWLSTATGSGVLQLFGDFDGLGEQLITPGAFLPIDEGTGFLGVVGSTPFTSIRFQSSSPTNNEDWQLDNLSLKFANAVPEPASVLLVALGLAGLALQRKWRPSRRAGPA